MFVEQLEQAICGKEEEDQTGNFCWYKGCGKGVWKVEEEKKIDDGF